MMFRKSKLNTYAINVVDVFLFIGDSNQNGAVLINSPSDIDNQYIQTENRCIIYYKPDRTTTNNGAWETYQPVGSGWNRSPGNARVTAYPYPIGADVGFARTAQTSSVRKIAIIKMARGGSSLLNNSVDMCWNKESNDLYNVFLNGFYKPAIQKLYTAGYPNFNIKGIIIRLGTNDCSIWNQSAFTSAVPKLVSDLRSDLNLPNLPIYWVNVDSRLSTRTDVTPPSSTVVSQAQSVINNAASNISNFYAINSYMTDALQSDNVHYTVSSYISQGINEASLLLNH